jgi:hypothetical protein
MQRRDVLLDAVVVVAGVGEDVTLEAGLVAQQLPHGHRLRGVAVGQVEVRQVGHDGRVQVEQPLVGQLQHQGRGPGLGDRANLEDRVGGRLDPGRVAQHAAREVEDLTVDVDADGGPGDLVLGEQRGQPLGDPAADVIQMWHAATLDAVAIERFVRFDEVRCLGSSERTNGAASHRSRVRRKVRCS